MNRNRKKSLSYRAVTATVDIAVFAMLAALMFALKVALAGLPNIEPVSLLIIVYTAVYRLRALIPIYIYVVLEGLLFGFNLYWAGYLYVWLFLWGAVMLIPKAAWSARGKKGLGLAAAVMVISGLFGLAFGTLTAPPLAFSYGFSAEVLVSLISVGLPFDMIHAIGNLAFAAAALPLVRLTRRLESSRAFKRD